MEFDLGPERLKLQKRVRDFCEGEIIPRAQENDRKEAFPWDLAKKLAREGLFGIVLPRDYGGMGLDALSLCLVLEELGRADAALALTVESHNGLCANHLFLHGNEDQKRRYLPRLATGEALGAWALTEPGAGSDAASIKTRAVTNGSGWILNGSKTFTTQGSVAGIYVIFARTDGNGKPQLTAFVAEKGVPGLGVGKIEKKMGIRASDTAQLHLHQMRLPAENVVGKVGGAFRDAMRVLDAGRVAIAAVSVGIARAALEEGIRRVKARPADYGLDIPSPGLTYAQKTLAQIASEIDAARLLTHRAAWLLDSGKPFAREASMAKLISGDLAMRAATEIVDLIGPEGGSLDSPVQRYFRDAKLYQIGEGSSQIQQLVISRQLLNG